MVPHLACPPPATGAVRERASCSCGMFCVSESTGDKDTENSVYKVTVESLPNVGIATTIQARRTKAD